jgi:hypothetical protein
VAALLAAFPAAASAFPEPTLYETTGGATASSLYKVNPATGATTAVGPTGYAITGLAQDPNTGVLYGVSSEKSPIAAHALVQLNPATGAATPVVTLSQQISDFSFDSSGRLFGWTGNAFQLAAIDKQTGAVTLNSTMTAAGDNGGANSFDRNDSLWLFGDKEEGPYYTVDTTSGQATERGTLTPIDALKSFLSAASWDCARTTLYATVAPAEAKSPANLVTIDTATGKLTNKGTTLTSADGLEWFCPLAFEFATTALTVPPGGHQNIAVTLGRGPRIKGAATVAYATKDGSAKAGHDFVAAGGTASFANNATQQPLSLTVTPDPKAGENRTFEVVLSNPSAGGSVGSPLKVTITTAKPKLKVTGPTKTKAPRPTFKLLANEVPAKFLCKLDGGKFKPCGKNGKKAKKLVTSPLKPGAHQLVVQAINGAGLKSKPVKKKFVVQP